MMNEFGLSVPVLLDRRDGEVIYMATRPTSPATAAMPMVSRYRCAAAPVVCTGAALKLVEEGPALVPSTVEVPFA